MCVLSQAGFPLLIKLFCLQLFPFPNLWTIPDQAVFRPSFLTLGGWRPGSNPSFPPTVLFPLLCILCRLSPSPFAAAFFLANPQGLAVWLLGNSFFFFVVPPRCSGFGLSQPFISFSFSLLLSEVHLAFFCSCVSCCST